MKEAGVKCENPMCECGKPSRKKDIDEKVEVNGRFWSKSLFEDAINKPGSEIGIHDTTSELFIDIMTHAVVHKGIGVFVYRDKEADTHANMLMFVDDKTKDVIRAIINTPKGDIKKMRDCIMDSFQDTIEDLYCSRSNGDNGCCNNKELRPDVDETIEYFKSVQKENLETAIRKNNDYGDSYWEMYKEFGDIIGLIRIQDKLSRLKSLLSSGKESLVSDESVDDTIMDLANYATLFAACRARMRDKSEKDNE